MLTESQIQSVVADVLEREGPYVNNPADRGGPTAWGWTQATANDYGLGDVRNLTRDQARDGYVRLFHDWKVDQIPDYATFSLVTDSCVNHGLGNGGKWLQQALHITADGDIGPVTQHVMAGIANWSAVYWEIVALRMKFYGAIVTKNASQATFASGWLNRLSSFISPPPVWA